MSELNVNKQIEDEESRILDEVAKMTPGSEEYSDAIKAFDTLAGVKLADEKFSADCEDKLQKNAMEAEQCNNVNESEHRKLNMEKIKIGASMLGVIIPALAKVYEVSTNRKNHVELLKQRKIEAENMERYFEVIMYFEEKGKVVSDAGRQFLNKILFKFGDKN